MKAALIADDLTGTNNAGVLVAKQGLAAITVTHDRPWFPDNCEVVCVDTDSRYVAPEEAVQRVETMTAWAAEQGAQAWCNRVDNLLRGNIGAEIDGMLRALGAHATAVVSPAFPALRRLVIDGHLMVNDVPVHENPVAASDPFAPVTQSDIGDLINAQMAVDVARLGRDAVDAGAQTLAEHLERLAVGGARVVIVDAHDDSHVATLAEAMARVDRVLVPVDPGPLSALYLKAVRDRRSETRRGKKVILALGSVTPISLAQIRHLLYSRGLEPVWLDPDAVIGETDARAGAIETAVAAALESLEGNEVIVVTTRHPDHEPLDLDALAKGRGSSAYALSKEISDGLAEAVVAIVEQSDGAIGGCFPSGGDVAASLFKVAGTRAIRVFGDVIPLTAHVAFMGGLLDGLRLVTKGGSIGEEDAMETCLAFLLDELRAEAAQE